MVLGESYGSIGEKWMERALLGSGDLEKLAFEGSRRSPEFSSQDKTRGSASPRYDLSVGLAAYINDSLKPALWARECARGLERLRQMMRCNFEEAGLHEVLGRAEGLRVEAASFRNMPAYGDGRMGPHEWIC